MTRKKAVQPANGHQVAEVAPPKPLVAEIIGRQPTIYPIWRTRMRLTDVDNTVTDYEFWDKLRRGKMAGYEFAGLFCQPVTQILAGYVFGEGPTLALEESGDPKNEADPRTYTDSLLKRWIERNRSVLTMAEVDRYALGDSWLIVNPDSTLSVANPESVEATYDPLDYRKLVQVAIVTKTDDLETRDEYRLDGRTVTLTWRKDNTSLGVTAGQVQTLQFQNLIGRLPVVHWPCDRSTNEQNGHPIYEALLKLFSRYDDLVVKAIDGAERMGNPIPSFEGMEDVQGTIAANATAQTNTYTDADGNLVSRPEIDWDQLGAAFIGKGGTLRFASPGVGWSGDLRDVLKTLFYLVLDHTRIPEFLWGGAIASSKASAETQLPPFVEYINMRRGQLEGSGADDLFGLEAEGGLLELADVWLRTRALTDPRVVVAPVAVKQWPDIMTEDEALQFEKIKYADSTSKLTDETTLTLLDLVDDPQQEVKDAAEEAKEAQEQQMDFNTKLAQAEQEANGPRPGQPVERPERPEREEVAA